MKKIVLAAAVGVLSFVAGLVGAYFAMPTVAPDFVETARLQQDSLALLNDSLLQSLRHDSLGVRADSSLLTLSSDAQMAALQDSLTDAERQLSEAIAKEIRLAGRVEQLERRLQAQARQQNGAKELAGTLAKLEDKERRALVGRLDTAVLQAIYEEASRSDRVLLLRAMTPERAARFVDRLMQPASPSISQALTSDG